MSIWDAERDALDLALGQMENVDTFGGNYRPTRDRACAMRLMEKHEMSCKKISATWWGVFCPEARPQHHKGPDLPMAICRAVAAIPNADGKTPADSF